MDVKHFQFEGHQIAYKTYGSGKRAVVLVHGLLFNQEMHGPLARKLAENGNFVITMDMAGHGKSDRPIDAFDMARYSHAVNRLLERLEISEAVVGGTSLGAGIGLEFAALHSDRLRGLLLDMPALERSIVGGAAVFTPILLGAEYAEPIVGLAARAMRLVPSKPFPYSVNMALDLMKREPRATSDVLKGLYFGRLAPPRSERMEIQAPALVIGHKWDPIHPLADAQELAEDLPNARFIEAHSVFELRLMPKRLTAEIVEFVDDCWKPRVVNDRPAAKVAGGAPVRRRGAAARAAATRRAASAKRNA
ncbi:MAG: alpha/beta hydrolase [Actinobacteria bacterium]|nr:alpha/beta hydrolase [Actinomycetota bacterium]